jgi:hypothetical protein
MTEGREDVFTSPLLLATAVLLLGLAIIEKGLNILGGSIPVLEVFPRQLLDWAVVLLILDIALSLRQVLENRLFETSSRPME